MNKLIKLFSSYTLPAISTFIIVLVGFISGKIVSNELGVNGMATYGVFINLTSLLFVFSNGGINVGVIKLASKYTDRSIERLFFEKILSITFWVSFFVSGLFVLFSHKLLEILEQPILKLPALFLAFSIIFAGINNTILSFLNSYDLILLTKFKIAQSVFTLVSLIGLTFFMGGMGVFFSLTLSQILLFILLLFTYFPLKNALSKLNKKNFDWSLLISLLAFSAMSLSTAVVNPISQILIRDCLVKYLGFQNAGIWQSLLRLSDGYMLFFTSVILYLYLPGLSKLNSKHEKIRHMIKNYVPLMIIAVAAFLVIYVFRLNIINIFYNDKFSLASEWLIYQLVGDLFKLGSLSLIYVIISNGQYRKYIFIEITFALLQIFLSLYFSIHQVTKASVFSYVISMILLFFYLLFNANKILEKS